VLSHVSLPQICTQQWFKEKVLADIAAEERRNDEEGTPRAGLSAYTLACLESELGIM